MIKGFLEKNWWTILIILLMSFFVLPYMGVIYYTMPRNDEFAGAFGITMQGGYSIANLVRFVVDQYINWEGNYSGVFVYTALNPLVIGNSAYTVKVMNIITFCVFVSIWTYIIYRCLDIFGIEKKNRYILAVVMLIVSMNCRFMRELLGWFTGYMYYTLQLLLGTLAVIMVYDLYFKDQKKIKRVLMLICVCIFELIGAGGTLHVSAILCFFALVLLLWVLYEKREPVKGLILFGSVFICTIINVIAPGHRVRKGDYESISILSGLIYTISCTLRELKRLCTDTFYPYVFLLLLVILMCTVKKAKKSVFLHPITVGIAGICCIMGSTFPVCYGYGEATMASRGMETLDLLYVLWSMLFVCSLANWLVQKEVYLKKESMLVLSIISILMISSEALTHVSIDSIPSIQCIQHLSDGSIKDYSDYWMGKLHEVETTADREVVIYVDDYYMDESMMIDRVMFQEDPTNWVNTAASVYYGVDSIRVQRTGK